ncbi:MAG: hypothetical protein AAGA48_05190 [Myxococcota bacterium]
MKSIALTSVLPVVFLGLTACPAPEPDPPPGVPPVVEPTGETGTDTGTPPPPPPYDPNGPITDTCAAASALFQALDLNGARTEYEACIAADADNGGAYIGLAMTELLLLSDRTSFVDALGRCGQPSNLADRFYGANGELKQLGAEYGGTSTIDVDFLDENGRTDLPAFDDPRIVLSQIQRRRSGGYYYAYTGTDEPGYGELRDTLVVEIAGSFSYVNEVRFELDVEDVYGDGSNVALAPGLEISIANLQRPVTVYTACGEPGSTCNGWYQSTHPQQGTIRVNQFGTEDGDTIELEVDVEIPSACANGYCNHYFALDGVVTDTLTGDFDTSWLPFTDVQTSCDDQNCDDRTAPYTVGADLCTVRDHLELNEIAIGVADDLEAVGDAFAAAADKAGRHEARFDEVFFIGKPLPFGAGEMRAFASFLHAAAASARLASGYNLMEPTAVPTDLTNIYTADSFQFGDDPEFTSTEYEYEYGQCVETEFYGLSVAEAGQQLSTNLFSISSVADFPAARQGMLEAFTELREAIASATGETELYDFAYATGWAVDVLFDLDTIINSLQGTDGTLPSAAGWNVTLDAFFTNPTDRTVLINNSYSGTVVGLVDSSCEDELFFDEDAADWLVSNGFGAMEIPNSAINGNGPYPVLLDGYRYEELENPQTGEPSVIMEPLLELFR